MSSVSKKSAKPSENSRKAEITRKTAETEITVSIDLDGQGTAEIKTPQNFLSHMLHLLARHGNFDLKVQASGDLPHHIIEDIAIVLGQAIDKALGDKKGIERYGEASIPMDESLATCVLDLSGRPYYVGEFGLEGQHVEDVANEDFVHFFQTLATHGKMNLHVHVQYGANNHHKVEACFKAFAHALRKAVRIISGSLLSTKGTLE